MPTPPATRMASGILEIADRFDAFLFDAFGVLVLGDTAIPGAADIVSSLKSMGKSVYLMTNSAALVQCAITEKYAAMGFALSEREILTSRTVLIRSLAQFAHIGRWGAIVPARGSLEDLPGDPLTMEDDPDAFWDAEGYLFLSGHRWSHDLQERLVKRLKRKPGCLLIGNPDLVAPRETGLSVQPGYYGHDVLDRVGGDVRFFGKPYANAYEMALQAIKADHGDIDRDRIAMAGDTLHTDILGAAAAGLRTILVTDHGVLKGHDVEAAIETSGIRPDFIIPAL